MPKKLGPMWIKWRYRDHGCGNGFKELFVPSGYEPTEWLCERDLVPHWGERFSTGRIEWKKIHRPSKSTAAELTASLKRNISDARKQIKSLAKYL